MKKKKIALRNIKVTSFVTEMKEEKVNTVKGGRFSDGPICDSREPEFCNWTYNAWCVSRGRCDTYEAFCTAPY